MSNVIARNRATFFALLCIVCTLVFAPVSSWADTGKDNSRQDQKATASPALISSRSGSSAGSMVSTVDAGRVANNTFILKQANQAVAVDGSSKNASASVLLASINSQSYSQKWSVIDAGGGYYYLLNANSGMVLQAAQIKEGGALVQNKWNKGANQQWAIIDCGNSAVAFVSKGGKYAIAANGGKLTLSAYSTKASESQKFNLDSTSLIIEGIYSIAQHTDSKKVLGVAKQSKKAGAKVAAGNWDNLKSQKIDIAETGSGTNTYYLRVAHTGFYLAVNGKGNVVQVAAENKQVWKAVANTGGISFVNASGEHTGKALAVSTKGTAVSKSSLELSSTAQEFSLQKRKLINGGKYFIRMGSKAKYSIVANKNSKKSGANIVLAKAKKSNAQLFSIAHVSGGAYRLVNTYTGKALAAVNGNVVQMGTGKVDNQQWIARVGAGGSVVFINKSTGEALSAAQTAGKGVNITTATMDGSALQRCTLTQLKKYEQRAMNKVLARTSKAGSKYKGLYYVYTNITVHKTMIFKRAKAKSSVWELIDQWTVSTGAIINGKSLTPLRDSAVRWKKSGSEGVYHGGPVSMPGVIRWTVYWTMGWGGTMWHTQLYRPYTHTIKDGRLGKDISMGCIRSDWKHSKWLYQNIPVGTYTSTWK